jgi:hypothetical protein
VVLGSLFDVPLSFLAQAADEIEWGECPLLGAKRTSD